MKLTQCSPFGIAICAAMLTGCTGTKILESTVLETVDPVDLSGKTIAVLALTGDEAMREDVENALVAELAAGDIHGLASHALVPAESARDTNIVHAALAASGADVLIALDLLGIAEETRYDVVDDFGYYYDSPFHYASYSALYDYRYIDHPLTWARTYKTYTVAVMVYRMADEKLVWKAISESFAPSGAQDFAREITHAASAALQQDGLLK